MSETAQYLNLPMWLIQGPDLQCLLKVKEEFSSVLIFQHAILNAKVLIKEALVVNFDLQKKRNYFGLALWSPAGKGSTFWLSCL